MRYVSLDTINEIIDEKIDYHKDLSNRGLITEREAIDAEIVLLSVKNILSISSRDEYSTIHEISKENNEKESDNTRIS